MHKGKTLDINRAVGYGKESVMVFLNGPGG